MCADGAARGSACGIRRTVPALRPTSILIAVEKRGVVVGFDGSRCAERALVQALGVASPKEPIIVVAAYSIPDRVRRAPFADELWADARRQARIALDRAEETALEAGSPAGGIEYVMADGEPAGALMDLASARDARMIVVGTHGWDPLVAALGGQTLRLLQCADRETLVVPAASTASGADVVVGIGDSDESDRAVLAAERLARPGETLHLTSAFHVPYVARLSASEDKVAGALREACDSRLKRARGLITRRDIRVEECVAEGRPARVLADRGAAVGARMITVASRGLSPLRSALKSSTLKLLEIGNRPVLVVPPSGGEDS